MMWLLPAKTLLPVETGDALLRLGELETRQNTTCLKSNLLAKEP